MIYFDWDAENLAHITRHGVTAAEMEYVLTHPTVDLGFQDWQDEERFSEAGPTAMGRLFLVVTTMRGYKTRIVTAYDAPAFAIRAYLLAGDIDGKRVIPKFANEAEEAQWWYDHREEIAVDMLAAVREGRNGIGTLGRARLRAAAQAEAEAQQTATTSRAT